MKNAFFVSASIACGKSSFINFAKNKGFESLSADEIAHKLLNENAKKIAALFADESLIKEGKIDRKKLGKRIFNSVLDKKKLEGFLHPLIKEEILKEAEILEAKNKPFFIELPLFFENDTYQGLGKSVLIYAPKETSLQRLIKRDNLSEKEALKRINSQLDIEEKKKKADFIIDNSKDLRHFEKECENFFESLKS